MRYSILPNQLNNSAVEVCLKEDVDKYIDQLTKAFLKLINDEFGTLGEEDYTEEGIEKSIKWALNR